MNRPAFDADLACADSCEIILNEVGKHAKQEQVEINIQEDMDVSQRSWLMAKLEHERGIIGAWFKGGDHHRLTVHYEYEHFSHVTLRC